MLECIVVAFFACWFSFDFCESFSALHLALYKWIHPTEDLLITRCRCFLINQ